MFDKSTLKLITDAVSMDDVIQNNIRVLETIVSQNLHPVYDYKSVVQEIIDKVLVKYIQVHQQESRNRFDVEFYNAFDNTWNTVLWRVNTREYSQYIFYNIILVVNNYIQNELEQFIYNSSCQTNIKIKQHTCIGEWFRISNKDCNFNSLIK